MDINFKSLLNVPTEKDAPTFLSVIDRDYYEAYLSSLIGYAISNDEETAKKLLEIYFCKFSNQKKNDNLLSFDVSQIDFELEKSMDGRRADIFIRINDSDNPDKPISTITIENKTNTSEHNNQTKDYFDWVNDSYKESNNAFFYLFPDYNPSVSGAIEFFDIKYSEFNKLISDSDDYIIQDLKKHIKQRLEKNSMNINNEEKQIIDRFNEYNQSFKMLSKKIKEKKKRIIESFNTNLKENGYNVISEDTETHNDELIIENIKDTILGTSSYRLYKSSWWMKNKYYLFLEIKFFEDKNGPFDMITFQQTIKGYNNQEIIKNYFDKKKTVSSEKINSYYVFDKKHFLNTNGYAWNTTDWENCLVKEATKYFIKKIKQCDSYAEELSKKFEI